MVQLNRPQITMRVACWIPKAAGIHSEYALLIIASPWQYWLPECTSILRYTCTASLVNI